MGRRFKVARCGLGVALWYGRKERTVPFATIRTPIYFPVFHSPSLALLWRIEWSDGFVADYSRRGSRKLYMDWLKGNSQNILALRQIVVYDNLACIQVDRNFNIKVTWRSGRARTYIANWRIFQVMRILKRVHLADC